MFTLILSQLGSFLLGMTLTLAILFQIASSRVTADASTSCLGRLICLTGMVAAISCYYLAITL